MMDFTKINSITIPEGIVNKITSNNLILWEIPYDEILAPYDGSEIGKMPITKINVLAGQKVTIIYYLTERQGYIYDGRKCGLNYYGSVSSSKYPMSEDEVGKECSLTLEIPQNGYLMISGYYMHADNAGNVSSSDKDACIGYYIKVKID